MKPNSLIASGALALALLAGGCSGGGTTSSSSATTTTSAADADPTTTAVADTTTAAAAPVTAGVPPATPAGAVDPNAPEDNPPGDIPDNQVFVAYSPPSGGFTVKVPEGWARTEANGAVTFTDKLNSVRMETVVAAAAPTAQSAQQSEVPAIQASAKGFQPGKVTSVTRKAGPVVLITYLANSAPDPVTGKVVLDDVERYEFWKAGKEVILTLSGPKGADNVDPWKIITDSFGWQ